MTTTDDELGMVLALVEPGESPEWDDDLDAVLQGIVIPAPAVRPDSRLPAGDPVEIPATVIRTVPAPAPPTPTVPPAPRPVPAAPPVPPHPSKAPTVAAPADAEPEPEQQAEQGVREPEDVTPPAWWTSPARRAAADRAAWEIGGDHAARTAARIAPLFDAPEADPNARPKKKPTRDERDATSAERARRFRRWCTLTVLSAGLGTELHLPQAISAVISGAWDAGGQWTGTGAAGFLIAISWSVDWYLRGGTRPEGATRIGDIRRGRLPFLVVVRVPFASALIAGLGADGLLDAATLSVHQLFS